METDYLVMNVLWTAMRPLCGWSLYSTTNSVAETGNIVGAFSFVSGSCIGFDGLTQGC